MNKTKQVWYLYSHDRKGLNLECVDILSKCYLELGQKPTPEQIGLMATILADDLANFYGSIELDEVRFAFTKGIRNADEGTSCFINVRQWNVWLKAYKKDAMLRRQQNLITEYQQYKDTQKLITKTINTVKKIK